MTAPAHTRAGGVDREGLRGRLIAVLTAMLVISVGVAGFAATAAFNRAVEPELANRTRLIGTIIRSELQRALELGIPIDAMAGLDRYLGDTLRQFEEVDRISISSANGKLVTAVGRSAARVEPKGPELDEVITVDQPIFRLPVLHGNQMVGEITVAISPVFVQTRLRDVFMDVGVLALVSVLVALELALAVIVVSVRKPLERIYRLLDEQQRGVFLHRIRSGGLGGLGRVAARLNDRAEDLAARLAALPARLRPGIDAVIAEGAPARLRLSDFNDIRLALFLFAMGTEIAAAFLPLYARTAGRPEWLSADIAAAAPLVFYLGAIALVSPFGSLLIRKFGARRLFLLAAPGAGIALTGLALSSTVIQIAIWQGVMATFYAMASIAGQEYAIRAAGERDRAKAVGAFVAVAYSGLFAGSALGGLIAGRFGFGAAYAVGATMAVLSVFLGLSSMRGRAGDVAGASDASGVPVQAGQARRSWITRRYLALLFGVSIPMNAATVIFIWYLTPLMLAETGSGPSDVARVLVLYNLAFFLFGPMVARLADRGRGPFVLIAAGAVVLGLALLSLSLWSGFWAIAVAVAGAGMGQVLMRTPVFAMALRINGGPGPGIDALRVIDRLGAIAGLAAIAVMLGRIGAAASLQALGVIVLAGVAIYATIELAGRGGRAP